MGTNNVYNPDYISTPVRATEPTSLAAFIGGSASGPRLNRHAPQQDAHDPTQFVQPDTSHPHPIFGRGGIAMAGMADKAYGSYAGSESSERYRPSLTAKPKSPSPVNASSKMETSNHSLSVPPQLQFLKQTCQPSPHFATSFYLNFCWPS